MQVATIEETVNSMVDEAGGQLKAIQEFLFTIMADVRMPLIDGIKFSRRQKKQLLKILEPGDIIATGTSSGVGVVLGKYLVPNDVVRIELENVGTLENKVVLEP